MNVRVYDFPSPSSPSKVPPGSIDIITIVAIQTTLTINTAALIIITASQKQILRVNNIIIVV